MSFFSSDNHCLGKNKPGDYQQRIDKENIRAFLKEHVAAYKMPRVIEFMDELPTSGVGKILKRELRNLG